MKFHPINKAIQYNSHPSGIEVILIADRLSFCLGNSFKYLMRCSHKGTCLQDLQKALWYLKHELEKPDPWYKRLFRWGCLDTGSDENNDTAIDQILEYETRYSGHMWSALDSIYVVGLMNGGPERLAFAIQSVQKIIRIEEARQEVV